MVRHGRESQLLVFSRLELQVNLKLKKQAGTVVAVIFFALQAEQENLYSTTLVSLHSASPGSALDYISTSLKSWNSGLMIF